jgi:ketosteroid isomerase-like protein
MYEDREYRRMLEEHIDPELQVRVHDSAMYRGTYKGVDGLLAVLREWAEYWAEITYEIEEIGERDDLAAAIFRYHGRGRSSGVPVTDRIGWLFEFRDDLLIRYEMYSGWGLKIDELLER